MPDLVELLQRTAQPSQPSLLDIASSLGRAQAEGTSLGKQLDTQQVKRSELAQREFTNTVAVMDAQYKQAKLLAEQGNADADAVVSAFESVTEGLNPEDRAKVWSYAESLPDDVGRSNAMTVFSRAISDLGVKKAPKEQTAGEYERLVTQYEAAQAAGDTQRANLLKRRLDYMTTRGGININLGGEGAPGATQEPASPITPPPGGGGIEQGTGVSGKVGGLVNTVSDWMGFGLAFPDVAAAQRALDRVNALTNTVMAAGVPGRPSNYVREQFEKIAPKKGMGDETAKNAVGETLGWIRREIQRMERDRSKMTSRSNLDKYTDALSNFRSLEAEYASILDNFDAQGVGEVAVEVPEGVEPEVWEFMTPEERALWQN